MELGNIIFGNSRGEFHIPRQQGWEEVMLRLFEAIGCDDGYGIEQVNDVFEVRPYYWGDCICGFEEADWKWSADNKCTQRCFNTRYHAEDKRLEQEKVGYDKRQKLMVKWAKANGFANAPYGMAVYCDCGNAEAYQAWRKDHDHTETCPIVLPNFLFKPTGLRIKWYKYIFRDSYMSQELSLEQFSKVIDQCIQSFGLIVPLSSSS